MSHLTLVGNVLTNDDACSQHPSRGRLPAARPERRLRRGDPTAQCRELDGHPQSGDRTTSVGSSSPTRPVPTTTTSIANNNVTDNAKDCGITLAGHNSNAVATSGANAGQPQPSLAGVYHNTITANVANGNGAAGVIMAGGPPGTGVYANHVTGNTANDNGIAGISIHSHAPFQDMNDNVITNNSLSHDALSGGATGGPGDSDAGVTQDDRHPRARREPRPCTGTVITGNHISNVATGVWLSAATPTATVTDNTISVTAGGTPIVVQRTGAPIVGIARTPTATVTGWPQPTARCTRSATRLTSARLRARHLNLPIVGMAATPHRQGLLDGRVRWRDVQLR